MIHLIYVTRPHGFFRQKMPQQQQALHTEKAEKTEREEEEDGGSRWLDVGRSIFRKQLRMAGRETKISHILTLIVIMRSPLKTSFVKHAHEQMKHNQIKLRFLVTSIAPTRYIQ